MRNLLYLFLLIAAFGKDVYADQCTDAYSLNQECPQDVCQIECLKQNQFSECVPSCVPKSCLFISAALCPVDRCQILDGCSGSPVCYPKISSQNATCGLLASVDQDIECCEGLVKRCGIEFFDRSCDMVGQYTLESVSMCLPCGNGVCNQFENSCNCPEDCK